MIELSLVWFDLSPELLKVELSKIEALISPVWMEWCNEKLGEINKNEWIAEISNEWMKRRSKLKVNSNEYCKGNAAN